MDEISKNYQAPKYPDRYPFLLIVLILHIFAVLLIFLEKETEFFLGIAASFVIFSIYEIRIGKRLARWQIKKLHRYLQSEHCFKSQRVYHPDPLFHSNKNDRNSNLVSRGIIGNKQITLESNKDKDYLNYLTISAYKATPFQLTILSKNFKITGFPDIENSNNRFYSGDLFFNEHFFTCSNLLFFRNMVNSDLLQKQSDKKNISSLLTQRQKSKNIEFNILFYIQQNNTNKLLQTANATMIALTDVSGLDKGWVSIKKPGPKQGALSKSNNKARGSANPNATTNT